MPEEKNRTAIRSTAVNEIIAHKPSFLIRHGNLIFLLILALILSASFFIRYPDVVSTTARMLPDSGRYYAEVFVPKDKLLQIQSGQKVLLKIAAYPFREYGMLEGRVSHIMHGNDSGDRFVKVLLTNGLSTNYHKLLTYQPGMTADADIITADKRLSERLIEKMKKSF